MSSRWMPIFGEFDTTSEPLGFKGRWIPASTPQQTGGAWADHELSGDRTNLKAGVAYEIGVTVLGSSITLDVDGVQVATATLPSAPNQARQIGIFCASVSDLFISRFS